MYIYSYTSNESGAELNKITIISTLDGVYTTMLHQFCLKHLGKSVNHVREKHSRHLR